MAAPIDGLVSRLRAFLASHALPPGSPISPQSVARQFEVDPETASAALDLLAAEGLLETDDAGGLRLSTHGAKRNRDLVARVGPVLVGMARIAAEAAEPADVLAMRQARDRMDAAIAVRDAPARGQAYRDFITAFAAATHNAFYTAAAAQLLREGSQAIDALMPIDLIIFTANSEDGELRRLVDAVAAKNPIAAAEAAQDHASLMAHRLDGLN